MTKNSISENTYLKAQQIPVVHIKKKNQIRRLLPSIFLLLLLLTLSYFIWDFTKTSLKNNQQSEFDKAVVSVITRLEAQQNRNIEIIRSMTGLYDLLIQVVRDYFDLYATIPVMSYPSITSVMYAPYVLHDNLGAYIFSARSQGYYDYKLRPEGEREYYYPIEHIVPNEKHGHRVGFDMGTISEVLTIIENARDVNDIVSTNILFLRETDTLGLYLIAPIYQMNSSRTNLIDRRNNFQGALILEIDTKLFFETALATRSGLTVEEVSFPSDTTIVFEMYGYDNNNKYHKLYSSDNSYLLETDYNVAVTDTVAFEFADKNVFIRFATIPDFGGKFQNTLPDIIFAGSILLSFVIFGFVVSMVTSKTRAQDLAERMTRSQRRIVDSSQDIIAIANFEGKWLSMNPACEMIFGSTSEEMLGDNIYSLFYSKEEADKFTDLFKSEQSEYTNKIVVKMKNKQDELKWLNWNITFSKPEKLIYLIGRDVTIEKLNEEEEVFRSHRIELTELIASEASSSKSIFLKKFSHQMRNSLTSIMGYLDLIANKEYEDEKELNNFITSTIESSEELFTYVSDIVDATLMTDSSVVEDSEIFTIDIINKNALRILKQSDINDIIVLIDEESKKAKSLVPKELLSEAFALLYSSLTEGTDKKEVQLIANENSYEGATEIQILVPHSQLVEEMIEIFKYNNNNLISVLKSDKNDILLKFAKASSFLRRMSGNIALESLGQNEGNLALITLPINKLVE